MGEIADLMIDGEICEGCGCELDGEAPGFPRRCAGCGGNAHEFGSTGTDHRAERRDAAQETLKQAGIQFYTNNGGVHLICSYRGTTVDVWPGRDKYRIRPPHKLANKTRHGLKDLINILKQGEKKDENAKRHV